MKNSQIIKQLLNGNHLDKNEIKQAEKLINKLKTNLETYKN